MVGWWEYFLIGWVAQSFSLHSELECDIDDFLSFIIRHHTGSLPERKVFAHIHTFSHFTFLKYGQSEKKILSNPFRDILHILLLRKFHSSAI